MEPKQKIPVIVFIEGTAPTEAERKLMEKHATKCCLTLSVERTGIRPHRFAVAADPKHIPEGYTTEAEYLKAEKDNKPKTGTPFITPPVVNAGPRGLAAE